MTMNAETSDTAAATAAQGPAGAPEKGSSKKHGSRKKGAPKARKTAVGGMSKKAGKKRSVKPATNGRLARKTRFVVPRSPSLPASTADTVER